MKLTLFFTRPIGINEWINSGLYDREIEIYKMYVKDGYDINFVTYGVEDPDSIELLGKNIKILKPSRKFNVFGKMSNLIYSFFSPIIHFKELKDSDIFKSNQLDGAWSAWIASKLFRGKFYLRTGYTFTLFYHNKKSVKYSIVKLIERGLYKSCDISSVSSVEDMKYISSTYNVTPKVIGNYISTQKFNIIKSIDDRSDRLLFIGRLNEQKNIFSMLDAVKRLNVGIDLFGDGELRVEIASYIKEKNIDAEIKGRVKNELIPEILNCYRYYVLASHYEGMPKSLIEAMACGCICIVTNVPGSKELIENGVTGFVATSTDSFSIEAAISKALCSESEQKNISNNARKLISSKYSLKAVYGLETNLIIKDNL